MNLSEEVIAEWKELKEKILSSFSCYQRFKKQVSDLSEYLSIRNVYPDYETIPEEKIVEGMRTQFDWFKERLAKCSCKRNGSEIEEVD